MRPPSPLTINWRRGMFRVWLVLSVAWCALSVVVALSQKNISWGSATKIHVKISNTDTWDYPADWGVARITADVERRLADLDRQDQEWAASVSESRKAQCRAIPSTTPFADQPEDCVKLFFSSRFSRAVPPKHFIDLSFPCPPERSYRSPTGVQTRQNLDSSSIMNRFPCGPAQVAHRCLQRFKSVAAPYLKTALVATARSLVQTTPLDPCRSQESCARPPQRGN
jgi:hypothetical protein